MADVSGKFYRATKVRTGVAPSSAGSLEGETLPPINPPGSSLNSVGLTMPSAFTVSNSPLTANGVIGVAGAGTVGQYIRGDGSLADFPQTSGGGSSVSYYLNGSVDQGTIGGIAYKELSKVPILGAGTDFTINANGYIASFITDAGDPNLLEIPGGNWNFETYFSASSGGGSPTFYVELYKVSGTTATLIASSSSAPELIAFGTNLTPYFSTLAVPTTTLALTDRLAVRYYVTHSGRTITLHTENNHLCQIITTFTTGLTALNGLTAQVQNFAVGTTGTDFNIASAVATHTFNLPTASATNRGALSSADWSMFNAKQNALTLTTTGTSGAATLVGATLNIPQYQAALTNPVTGTGSAGQVAYWSSGSAITGESELFWDATNNRLGIGISPTAVLDVRGPNALGTFFNARNDGAGGAVFERIGNSFPFNRYTFLNGVIGVNTPAPNGALHIVNPSGAGQPVLELQQQNSGSNIVQWRGSAGTYLGIIADNGNVGIGTVDPTSSFNARLAVRNEDASNNPTLVLFKNINSASSEDVFRIQSWNGAFNTVASIKANGSANFSGSITATSIIRSGGTSSQYLMADGSVSTLSNPVTGTGTTNYLPKFTGSTTIGNSNLINDASGNLGLGITPSAWGSSAYGGTTRVLELGELGSSIGAGAGALIIGNNWYSTNSAAIYSRTGFRATYYAQNTALGEHQWYNAPSGTAGNAISFTQAMTLFATGNLLVGSPSPISDNGARLQISGTAYAVDFLSSTRGINVSDYGFLSQTLSGQMTILGHNVRSSNSVANQVNVVNGGWISSMIKQYYSDGITFHTDTTVYSAGAVYPMASTERMRIFSEGQVHIGPIPASNNGARLQVSGNGTFTGTGYDTVSSAEIQLNNTSASGRNFVLNSANSGVFQIADKTAGGATRLLINSTGAVTFFNLAGSGNRIIVANSGGTLISAVIGSGLAFDGTTLTATGGGSGSISGNGISGFIPVFTGATSIGNSILSLSSNTLDQNRTSEGTFYRLLVNGNGRMTLGTDGSANAIIRTGNNVDLRLGVNEDAITIKNGGNVGIGTVTVAARLSVVGAATVIGQTNVSARFSDDNNSTLLISHPASTSNTATITGNINLGFATGASGSITEKVRILANGNVLIGTQTDNGSLFRILGPSGLGTFFHAQNAGAAGAIFERIGNTFPFNQYTFANGNVLVGGSVTATGFFESSDATLKTLIADNYQVKGIDSVVAKLYIKNGKEELGYFAQDLQDILPSAVSKGSDGLLNLSYREVHTAKIAYLEEKIKQIEKKYEIN